MAAQEDTERSRFVLGARGAPTPQVTLRKDGRVLAFNRAAYVALGRPAHVELLFDRGRREIAVRPVPAETEHSYFVTQQPGTAIWVVSAILLSRTYGLIVPEARRFAARLVDGLLVADVGALG